jgi:glycosyltransferase involved in cell wall biosynthesis
MSNYINIYFLENSFDYNGSDLDTPNIGGSEKTLINITNELAKEKRFIIKVFNNTTKSLKINDVTWKNINEINKKDIPDYLIAMSDANLFYKLNCKKNYLWSHSIQTIEKFIRKKQLFPFLKFKPIMILEGDYHYNSRSLFTSLFGKKILKIAPDYDFIDTIVDLNFIPDPVAIFTTKSDRNLDFLLSSWLSIKEKSEKAKLYINPPFELTNMHIKKDIYLRIKGDKKKLINDLINSKLFLNPGHKTEVFCLAAEEARELCIPIVTMGYGCLYERVEHEKTGFIAKNKKEFIEYSNLILNDDSVYINLKKNLHEIRNSRNYALVKKNLLKILNI